MNDRTQSLINTANDEERLDKLLSQASALIMTTYGVCGDSFRKLPAAKQDAILWTLSDMIHEIADLARSLVWDEGATNDRNH